jgi:hypothetical protein
MSTRLLPWNALKAVHDHFASVAFDICATGEEVPPVLMAVKATVTGEVTQMVGVNTGTLHTNLRNETGKDSLARLLRGLLTDNTDVRRRFVASNGFSPDLFVQGNEAWIAAVPPGTEPSTCGRPSKSRHRKEVIAICLHSRQGTVVVCHEIATKPNRHALPAEFPTPEAVQQVSGRFSVQDMSPHQEHTVY